MPEKNRISMSLFTTEEAPASTVMFNFEDRKITAPQGISIAAALLLNGAEPFRNTPVNGNPRSAFCMMGACFDCLVEVDGLPNRQACQICIQDGMIVKRQDGAPILPLAVHGNENE